MNKAFLGPGEAEALLVLLENVAEQAPWEERASLENPDRREESGTAAPVERRETMGETELVGKDAQARREKEDSLATQAQRAPLAIQEQLEHQDPKASEAEGETQDLQGPLGRRETLATQDHLVPKATEATRSINVPWFKVSKTSVLVVTGPWSAPSSRRS